MARSRAILQPMRNWLALSEDERKDIENNLMAALNSIGIKGAVTRWSSPGHLPHWRLTIETSWCANKSRNDVSRALEQAMARVDIEAPINGVLLRVLHEK